MLNVSNDANNVDKYVNDVEIYIKNNEANFKNLSKKFNLTVNNKNAVNINDLRCPFNIGHGKISKVNYDKHKNICSLLEQNFNRDDAVIKFLFFFFQQINISI